jgi:hypothetical protein
LSLDHSLYFSHLLLQGLPKKGAARHSVAGNKAAALAMWAVATSRLTVLRPREALRLARKIARPKIAPLKTALKATLRTLGSKRAIPKTIALNKIVVLSAISLLIQRCLTFTTMTPGSAMIRAVVTSTITWIIHGNTGASLAASGVVMSTVSAEGIAIASGSTIFISAWRRTTTIT